MKSNDIKNQFIELRAKGNSFDKIAKELKVSKQTLIDWSNEFELEIQNLKAIELETLQEKYFLNKRQRIEIFGEKLNAIKEELYKRDLSKVSTEKLLDLFSKYFTYLNNEVNEIEFVKPVNPLEFGLGENKTWKP